MEASAQKPRLEAMEFSPQSPDPVQSQIHVKQAIVNFQLFSNTALPWTSQ